MGLLNINGISVLSGTIMMPLLGVWTADLVIDQPDGSGFSANTPVTIESDDGFTLNGVIDPHRTGDLLDAVHVRVLGGAGGMAKPSSPKSFVRPGAYARDVVSSLTTDSGETLSPTADASFLATNLNAWAILKMPVSQALQLLIDDVAPANHWRILSDGTLWVGAETWPDSSAEFVLLMKNPADATYELGVDSPLIVPGTTLQDIGQVNRVEHQLLTDTVRTRVWVNMPDQERGVAAAISALINQELAAIDYFALYQATMVSQSADMTMVDLQPDDKRLPGMGSVPLRHGLPGLTVQVAPGCNLLLGWDAGNPSKPYACLWGGGETVLQAIYSQQQMLLGGETAADFLIKGTTYRTAQIALDAAFQAFVTALNTSFTALGTASSFGQVNSAASPVPGACTTMNAALVAFEVIAATSLSTVTRTV